MGCRYPPHERDHQSSAGILPAASAPGILPGGPNASQEGQTPTKTTFAYDALHLRIARHESSTTTTTFFVYEGWNVIAEYKATSTDAKGAASLPPSSYTLHTSNVWGEDLSGTMQCAGGIGGLLASTLRTAPTTKNEEPSAPNVFYHYDSNGNIVLLTHTLPAHANDAAKSKLPAKALIAAQYRYDAFGRTIKAEGPLAQVNRYQFSTKPVEAESELVYYGYRYLDTTHGRWISRDPIGERGGVNVYGLLGGQSINRADMLGLISITTEHCPCRDAVVDSRAEAIFYRGMYNMLKLEAEASGLCSPRDLECRLDGYIDSGFEPIAGGEQPLGQLNPDGTITNNVIVDNPCAELLSAAVDIHESVHRSQMPRGLYSSGETACMRADFEIEAYTAEIAQYDMYLSTLYCLCP